MARLDVKSIVSTLEVQNVSSGVFFEINRDWPTPIVQVSRYCYTTENLHKS